MLYLYVVLIVGAKVKAAVVLSVPLTLITPSTPLLLIRKYTPSSGVLVEAAPGKNIPKSILQLPTGLLLSAIATSQ